jgi:hypothetical protein
MRPSKSSTRQAASATAVMIAATMRIPSTIDVSRMEKRGGLGASFDT